MRDPYDGKNRLAHAEEDERAHTVGRDLDEVSAWPSTSSRSGFDLNPDDFEVATEIASPCRYQQHTFYHSFFHSFYHWNPNVKALGVVIGLLMLAGVCSNLTGGDEQPATRAQSAPVILSTPPPPPTVTPPAPPAAPAVQAASKPAAPAAAPRQAAAPKQPAAKPAAAPAPAKPAAKTYTNCSEAKAAGAAPILSGEPGYSSRLDRDGDGIACEK